MLEMHTEMHVGIHVKCLLLSDFNQNFNISTNYSKTSQYQVLWKSVQQWSHADRWSDRHGKARSTFGNSHLNDKKG
jgi:hypothetical protein